MNDQLLATLSRFKDPSLAHGLILRISALAADIKAARGTLHLNLMEVCGTHTVAIARSGLRSVLPEGIRLISGPGCPVCVTANASIDLIIAATRLAHTTLCTFGDMIRVPGSSTSLQERKAEGARIEVVYSPLDALELAKQEPSQQVVFAAVGFETTTPLTAATIKRAAALGVKNFSVLAIHKRVAPALQVLANDPELALDALILPGHVSIVLGVEPYWFLAERYGIPAVVAGFEPLDLLLAIAKLLEQIRSGKPRVENVYERVVRPEGNAQARASMSEIFAVSDATWRGLGAIPQSGHVLCEAVAQFDAAKRFDLAALVEPTTEPKGCRCGSVLRGVLAPNECPHFAKTCTPAKPLGPCMVSSEGSCAAYYTYQIA